MSERERLAQEKFYTNQLKVLEANAFTCAVCMTAALQGGEAP